MEEVERMERRERDKQERAKMSLIQNLEPEPEMPCLFSAPFRVRAEIFLKYIQNHFENSLYYFREQARQRKIDKFNRAWVISNV